MAVPLLRRASAVLALLALTLVTLAGPAQAGRRTVDDARRDAVKQAGDAPARKAPGNRTADITAASTELTARRLVLTTRVRELPRNYWAMLWEVETDTGARFSLDLLKTGSVRFVLSSGGADVACEGMVKRVRPQRDQVTAVVPLSCLGEPASVRVGAGAAATARGFGRIFTDDAGRTGRYRVGSELRLGRTVKRG